MGLFDIFKSKKSENEPRQNQAIRQQSQRIPPELLNQQLQNDIRIMNESLELVNTSKNIETVVYRFDVMIQAIERLAMHEDSTVIDFPKEKPTQVLIRMETEVIEIMNQAVDRALEKVLADSQSLKTESAREKRIKTFFELLAKLSPSMKPETQQYIQSLAQKYQKYKVTTSVPNNDTSILSITESTMSNLGNSKEMLRYAELSVEIQSTKDIQKKIALCEESLTFLPQVMAQFQRENSAPPSILCRDVGPELCMRLGEWKRARQIIEACIQCNAYANKNTPSTEFILPDGEVILSVLTARRQTSSAAYMYIQNNPGTLQSKIYKAPELQHLPQEELKWFCRNSHLIKKEKEGNTNKLYVVE